jgi:hypothetical protein
MGRSNAETKAAGTSRQQIADAPDAARRRAAIIAFSAAFALTAIAAGVWWLTVTLSDARSAGPQRTEIAALSGRLDAISAAITPIANDFTTEPTSGVIDVTSYRTRIASARRLVDEVNGIVVTDADALQLRDLIVTGGSQVLTGMDMALDALVSDEASATGPAGLQVEQGLQTLQEARDLLRTLTGNSSLTRLRGGGVPSNAEV